MPPPTRCTGRTLLVAVVLLFAVGRVPAAWATAGDATADRVLGQLSFVGSGLNMLDGQGLFFPTDVAIDVSATPHRLYVSDTTNQRVLAWSDASGFANGAPADLVIGQPDFVSSGARGECSLAPSAANLCAPRGIAVDELGNLYVADSEYHRVLEYDTPFATDAVADRVFGQGDDFTTSDCNGENGVPSLATLCLPLDVVVDSNGNLYVVDGNHRVLGYEVPFLGDTTADMVFGGTVCDPLNVSPTATSLCSPSAVAIDAGDNLYIADSGNNRVLEYDWPIINDTTADRVFGQLGNFTTRVCQAGAGHLCGPQGVAVDSAGNVVIADTGNKRLLVYTAPLVIDTIADRVVGQAAGNFTAVTSSCESTGVSPSASTFCEPVGVALDADGDLYVADRSNHRVLAFDAATDAAARVLGQTSFAHGGANLVDARGVVDPVGLAIDRSSTPARLYAADYGNSRVLAWADAAGFASGAPADLVIGQPDLASSGCNTGGMSASTLCDPRAVAVDATGNVYIADSSNNRILQYDAPFTTDTVADRVSGQNGSFATSNCAAGPNGLCTPRGVAVDAAGNLWVADTDNARVLEYDNPLATDTTADRVFGQRGSFATTECANLTRDAETLCDPRGVAVDGAGNLFVADDDDSRVLQYDAPLTSDTTADRVFGQQGSFTTDECSKGLSPAADNLCSPSAVLIDGAGNLYVADAGNARVLQYDSPLTSDATADRVFGQEGSFVTGDCDAGADGLCNPQGIAIDATGTLYVADDSNHRILSYDTPLPLTPSAAKAARKCQQTIVKAAAAFVQAELKTLQKCEDAKVKRKLDSCPDAKATAAVLKVKTKLGSVIAKACCGKDKQCTGSGDDQTLVDIGWNVGHCPTFARGACANPIAHAGDVATCLTCLGDAAVADVLGFAYGALVPTDPKLQKALNVCQQAIGKAATTFATVSSKAIAKCWDAVGKGKTPGPCPDGAAQAKIAAAEAKKVAKICKACGGGGDKTPADGRCDAASPLNPRVDIGFPSQCPERQVPGGADCAAIGAIVTLDDVIDCVDCVAGSSADCANRGAVPALAAYPLECRP